MRLQYVFMLKSVFIAATGAVLAACATATPFPMSGGPNDNAMLKGSSALEDFIKDISTVSIEAVNGKAVGITESSVLLPPGRYAVKVVCSAYPQYEDDDPITANDNLDLILEAGHEYTLNAERSDNGPAGVELAPDDKYTRVVDDISCTPYAYDSTGGRNGYSESMNIPLAGQWSAHSSHTHAGYAYTERTSGPEPSSQWQWMVKTESFTKPMFSGDADDFYKQHFAARKVACPGMFIPVLIESADDVTYEFEIPETCTGIKTRSEFGRFMTGKFGIYRAAILSRVPAMKTDATDWLQVLHSASITEAQ